MARKTDTAVWIALLAIPIGSMAAFLLWKMMSPGGPAPDMKGYIFDANTQSCGCGGK